MPLQTLDKFIEEERRRLDKFAAWWREQREKEGAKDWPLRMPEADWVEQLQIYGWPT